MPRSLVPSGLLVLLLAVGALAAGPPGAIDVVEEGADPSGSRDATAVLQAAIDRGLAEARPVWIPAGRYRVSDRLLVQHPPGRRGVAGVILGSTADPARRSTLVLAPGSPGFGDPEARRVVVHFLKEGPPEAEQGNADLFDQALVSVDVEIGPGNPGAVGVRMQGAEGCTIQDVTVDLRAGGHTGFWGLPASGGATHRVAVLGGRIGIDLRRHDLAGGGTQPQPVLTGAELVGQEDAAILASARGSLVVVGSRIARTTPGPAVLAWRHWEGQPFDGSVQLVDCRVEFPAEGAGNVVVAPWRAGQGRSVVLEDTFVLGPARLVPGEPVLAAGWHRARRAAFVAPSAGRPWGMPDETPWVDGRPVPCLAPEVEGVDAPPADLLARHRWDDDVPTWESPGVVDAREAGVVADGEADAHGALQALVDASRDVFLPPGTYRLSRTLQLRPDTRLFGLHPAFTRLHALDSNAAPFGVADGPGSHPLVRTAAVADAPTYLAFLHLKRAWPRAAQDPTPPSNHALEWLAGGRAVLRHVELQSRPDHPYRPDLARRPPEGRPVAGPVDPNHPQASFPPGEHAWPVDVAPVQVRGTGGGRWYTAWMHGRQGLREDVPFLLADGVTGPWRVYHLHAQQQDSAAHVVIRGSRGIDVFGTKGELKGAMVLVEGSRDIRLFGHGGMGTPDGERFAPGLFRFVDSEDFQVSGIGDTIREESEPARRWIGGPFDRWLHACLLDWHPVLDEARGRAPVAVPGGARPIVYRRGNPGVARQP